MAKGAELSGTFSKTGIEIIDFAFSKNGQRYWNCICPLCKSKFVCKTSRLQSSTNPTKSCGCLQKKKAGETLKQFRYDHTIDLTGQSFGKLTVIKKSDIQDDKRKNIIWDCVCECNPKKIIRVNGFYLRNGDTKSCGCLKSVGEMTISKILFENNINFIREKSFKTLRYESGTVPKFDFYIPDKNYLIEYDGDIHFNVGHGWATEERFKEQQKKDEFKNNWCKENNITLIRIPYTKLNTLCLNDLLIETSDFIKVKGEKKFESE